MHLLPASLTCILSPSMRNPLRMRAISYNLLPTVAAQISGSGFTQRVLRMSDHLNRLGPLQSLSPAGSFPGPPAPPLRYRPADDVIAFKTSSPPGRLPRTAPPTRRARGRRRRRHTRRSHVRQRNGVGAVYLQAAERLAWRPLERRVAGVDRVRACVRHAAATNGEPGFRGAKP